MILNGNYKEIMNDRSCKNIQNNHKVLLSEAALFCLFTFASLRLLFARCQVHMLASVLTKQTTETNKIHTGTKNWSKQPNIEPLYPLVFIRPFSLLLMWFSSQKWGILSEVMSVQMGVKELRDSISFFATAREEWLLPWLCGPDHSLSGWVKTTCLQRKAF